MRKHGSDSGYKREKWVLLTLVINIFKEKKEASILDFDSFANQFISGQRLVPACL